MKKSQITPFVIIGLFLLVVAGLFLIVPKKEIADQNFDSNEFDSEASNIKMFVNNCLTELLKESVNKHGVSEESKPKIKGEIESKAAGCISVPLFEEKGYKLVASHPEVAIIIDEIVQVDLDMQVTISKNEKVTLINNFRIEIPKSAVFQLKTDSGILLEDANIYSPEGGANIHIPKGTMALDAEGNPATAVMLSVVDLFNSGQVNEVVMGNTYQALPDGLTFSNPAKISIKYDSGDIPAGFSEEDLAIAYFDHALGIWRGLPSSTVDKSTQTINAETNHFSDYRVTFNCGKVDWQQIEYDYGRVYYHLFGDDETCNGRFWVEEKEGEYNKAFHEKESDNYFPQITALNEPTKYQYPKFSFVKHENAEKEGPYATYYYFYYDDLKSAYTNYIWNGEKWNHNPNSPSKISLAMRNYFYLPTDWDKDDQLKEGVCYHWYYDSYENKQKCQVYGYDIVKDNGIDLFEVEESQVGFFTGDNNNLGGDTLKDESCVCKDNGEEDITCDCDLATFKTFGYKNKDFRGAVKLPFYVPKEGACIMEDEKGIPDISVMIKGSEGDYFGYEEGNLFEARIRNPGLLGNEYYNDAPELYFNLDFKKLLLEDSDYKGVKGADLINKETSFKPGWNQITLFVKNGDDDACLWADAKILIRGSRIFFEEEYLEDNEWCDVESDTTINDWCEYDFAYGNEIARGQGECIYNFNNQPNYPNNVDMEGCYKMTAVCKPGQKKEILQEPCGRCHVFNSNIRCDN